MASSAWPATTAGSSTAWSTSSLSSKPSRELAVRTDNTAFIVKAAHDRRGVALEGADEALRRLDHSGGPVNFWAVADAAGVSRSWLYREPRLRAEIERLRQEHPTGTSAPPSAQRASAESFQRRLEAALDEVGSLKQENRQLREQVARLYGERRDSGGRSTP
jgi:HAMP domain-containing protein